MRRFPTLLVLFASAVLIGARGEIVAQDTEEAGFAEETAAAPDDASTEGESVEAEEFGYDPEDVEFSFVTETARDIASGIPVMLIWLAAIWGGVMLINRGRAFAGGLLACAAIIHLVALPLVFTAENYLWYVTESDTLIEHAENINLVIDLVASIARAGAWLMILGAVFSTGDSPEPSPRAYGAIRDR